MSEVNQEPVLEQPMTESNQFNTNTQSVLRSSQQFQKSGINFQVQGARTLQNSGSQGQYFLPQIGMQKKKVWNPRFHVSSRNNLAKAHPFYRNYFDKNERVNDQRLLKPYHPEKSMKEIVQHQQTLMMRRSQSQAALGKWDDYFSKMHSKNNDRVHNNFREFFDKPIQYDQKGYSGQFENNNQHNQYSNINFAPMEVYHKYSPKGKQIKQQTSSDFYKSQKAERFLNTNKSVAQLQDPEILQLRTAKSPEVIKKESKWNQRIGLPISTFNEHVFPRYRITFNNL
ncbi:UNKNOWN [Stylonychia lemnae]|uniref:Uncharacterized protein n=1 Tax=Stylonychia lemnae TaxID=5949 RepID=A0A078BA04_STYLE|nr:UNKNOWN [Stylonychia lemnae]|eukprot:CDW90097.1 UNKNOWN [Stylonychia lemnae]